MNKEQYQKMMNSLTPDPKLNEAIYRKAQGKGRSFNLRLIASALSVVLVVALLINLEHLTPYLSQSRMTTNSFGNAENDMVNEPMDSTLEWHTFKTKTQFELGQSEIFTYQHAEHDQTMIEYIFASGEVLTLYRSSSSFYDQGNTAVSDGTIIKNNGIVTFNLIHNDQYYVGVTATSNEAKLIELRDLILKD